MVSLATVGVIIFNGIVVALGLHYLWMVLDSRRQRRSRR
jgi:hypothetical protein